MQGKITQFVGAGQAAQNYWQHQFSELQESLDG
jgi:hypothetical protein